MIALATYFGLALAASLMLTPVCRSVARSLGYVARPKEDRWHQQPTPLMGGLAIAIPVILFGATIRPIGELWQLLACGAIIAAVGLLDDVMSLKPSSKLIAQIVVASLLLFLGYRLHWTESPGGDVMLTLLWIVGITNAFNLLDNMDGLCGGIATIASVFLLGANIVDGGATPVALYLATLAGATIGFLVFNVAPASIFMGDAGSLFLGLNLATLTLVAREGGQGGSGVLSVMAAPVLLLMIPIFDTTLVTALRVLSKRAPSQGGKDHTSHRLVAIGLSERTAVGVLWILAILAGGITLLLELNDPSWGSIVALTFVLALAIFAVYLSRIRVYEDADLALLRNQALTPLVFHLMYKRRVAEVLLDLCVIPLAYYAAYRLRFEGPLFSANYHLFLQSLPIVIAAQIVALFVVGGYRGVWRYFGMMDAVVFAKGVILGTVGAELMVLYLYRFESYSRAVFVIYAALLMLMLSGSRASFRLVAEFINRRRSAGRRCVIYGASGAALATIREAFGADTPLRVIGFIDDDPLQRQVRVQGYSVMGDFNALVGMIERSEVDSVVLNTHLIGLDHLRALEEICRIHDVEFLRLQVHLKRISAAS
jgi:UDP-GlcNAc:undecaprenyl-phosphate GlcNAc-1-phosphate transferase